MGVSLFYRMPCEISPLTPGVAEFLQGQEFRLQFDNLYNVLKYEKGYVKKY